jgi:hypothetical protein
MERAQIQNPVPVQAPARNPNFPRIISSNAHSRLTLASQFDSSAIRTVPARRRNFPANARCSYSVHGLALS